MIRKAKSSESEEISKLRIKTIKKINSKDYNSEQIKTLINKNKPEDIKRKIIQKEMFCRINKNKKILGVISLYFTNKQWVIGGLFIDADEIKKGYGSELLKYVEDIAKKQNIKRLVLYSTPHAVSFYKKKGYKIIKIFNGKINGVKFPITEMIKNLS